MKSNVKLSDLGLFEHASQVVAIVLKDGVVGIDGVLEVFVNNETLAEFLNKKRKESDAVYQYVEDQLGIAAKYTLDNEFEAMALHSILGTEFVITREDLEPMRDLLESFWVLNSVRRGKMSLGEASKLMSEKEVYCLSAERSVLERGEKNFIPNFSSKISAYLTYESAVDGEESEAIKSLKLLELARKFDCLLPIIIEPKRDFSVEFSPMLFK